MPTPTPTLVIPELDPAAPGELPESGGIKPETKVETLWAVSGPFEGSHQVEEILRLAQVERQASIYLILPKTTNPTIQPCMFVR